MGVLFYYYDMFRLLSNGHYLVRFGRTEPFTYLLKTLPVAQALGKEFVDNGWVRRVVSEDNGVRTFYSLSQNGFDVFEHGKEWYNNLPFWYKIFGRFFV